MDNVNNIDKVDINFKNAMQLINNTIKSINYKINDNNNIEINPNIMFKWSILNIDVFEKGGGWIMPLTDTKFLVRLFSNTKAKLHKHEEDDEIFRLIKGKLTYKIYKDRNDKPYRVGVLKPGQSITINQNEWHIVFTNVEEAILEMEYI